MGAKFDQDAFREARSEEHPWRPLGFEDGDTWHRGTAELGWELELLDKLLDTEFGAFARRFWSPQRAGWKKFHPDEYWNNSEGRLEKLPPDVKKVFDQIDMIIDQHERDEPDWRLPHAPPVPRFDDYVESHLSTDRKSWWDGSQWTPIFLFKRSPGVA